MGFDFNSHFYLMFRNHNHKTSVMISSQKEVGQSIKASLMMIFFTQHHYFLNRKIAEI